MCFKRLKDCYYVKLKGFLPFGDIEKTALQQPPSRLKKKKKKKTLSSNVRVYRLVWWFNFQKYEYEAKKKKKINKYM